MWRDPQPCTRDACPPCSALATSCGCSWHGPGNCRYHCDKFMQVQLTFCIYMRKHDMYNIVNAYITYIRNLFQEVFLFCWVSILVSRDSKPHLHPFAAKECIGFQAKCHATTAIRHTYLRPLLQTFNNNQIHSLTTTLTSKLAHAHLLARKQPPTLVTSAGILRPHHFYLHPPEYDTVFVAWWCRAGCSWGCWCSNPRRCPLHRSRAPWEGWGNTWLMALTGVCLSTNRDAPKQSVGEITCYGETINYGYHHLLSNDGW